MITDTHVSDYINSLYGNLRSDLEAIEAYALEQHVPIIRKEAQNLLCFLLRERKPKRLLEIGAAIGFSCRLMASVMPKDATITTIEKVEMRLMHTRKNLAEAPEHERITLLEGDATEVLKRLEGPYDFIFLDAAKAQYMHFLPEIMRLLQPGGLLVTDNVLQEGSLAQSKYTIERRDRTIHMRMREFLHAITHDKRLDTVILPVGDGMALSRRLTDSECIEETGAAAAQ